MITASVKYTLNTRPVWNTQGDTISKTNQTKLLRKKKHTHYIQATQFQLFFQHNFFFLTIIHHGFPTQYQLKITVKTEANGKL